MILLLVVLLTLINMYYKPYLTDNDQPIKWLKNITYPISKSSCAYHGFKCPSDELCDCQQICSNGQDFVPYRILDNMKGRIFVMNQKLVAGTYCLPKGAENCDLKTSYHIFSRAGWTCLNVNNDIFANHKMRACKNEEAQDNSLNNVYDYLMNKNVDHEKIENYYEKLPGQDVFRYRCKCDSLALDDTSMISVFPFVCSVDFCLRDIPKNKIVKGMGWDFQKEECQCGPYPHMNLNDRTTPCRMYISKMDNNELTGRVNCMKETSFQKYPLICPPGEGKIIFTQIFFNDSDPTKLLDFLLH